MADEENNESRSTLRKLLIYGGGIILILAGLGGLVGGGLGAIGGLIWIATGLLTLPPSRRAIVGAITGAGGPDLSTLGSGAFAALLVGGFVLGAVMLPASGGPSDQQAIPSSDGAAPTESTGPTEASADSGASEGAGEVTDTPGNTATSMSEPTPTPTPEPTPAPDGQSYDYSGSGQTATDTFSTEGGLLTIDFSHQGEGNFIVYLVNADTGEEELLVNVIGNLNGKVATNVPAGEFLLDIQADGTWEASIEQPRFSRAEVKSIPADAQNEDFAVLGPYQFEGVTRFSIDAETDSNVIVWLLDHEGNRVSLLVNEIGPHEGSTTIRQEGIGIIYVETEESWTVTLEQV